MPMPATERFPVAVAEGGRYTGCSGTWRGCQDEAKCGTSSKKDFGDRQSIEENAMTRTCFVAAASALIATTACLSGCQWFQRAAPPAPRPTKVEGYPAPEPLVTPPRRADLRQGEIEKITVGDLTTILFRPARAPSQSIAATLGKFLSMDGQVQEAADLNMLIVRDRNERVEALEKMLRFLDRRPSRVTRAADRTELIVDGDQTTIVYNPAYARADTLATALKGFVSLDGRVSASSELNRLIILDRTDRVEPLIKITTALDLPTPQVLVEARVLEITLSNDFEFDIKHTFTNLLGEDDFLQGGEIELKAPGPSPTTDQGLSFLLRPLSTDRDRVDTALRILYKEGRAKILSAPSQIVEVGHEANLITGEEVPIFASTVTGGSTTVSTEFKPVGVKLQVTPLRVSGDTIELEVNPEVSAVTGSSQGPEGSTAPIVASRSTRTTLRLKDGQILSIAGLMRNDVFKDVNKIPVLGDLPLAGPLFRSTRDRYTRTQLVFLLRVHILDDGEPWTIRTHAPGGGLEPLDDEFEKRVDELKAIDDSRKQQPESARP